MRKAVSLVTLLLATVASTQMSAFASEGCNTFAPAISSTAKLPTRPNREIIPALPMPSRIRTSAVQQKLIRIQQADVTLSQVNKDAAPKVVLRGPISLTPSEAPAFKPTLIASSRTDAKDQPKEQTKRAKLMHFLHVPTL